MTEKNLTTTQPTLEEQRKAKWQIFKKLWVSTAKLNSTAFAELDETDVSIAFTDLEKYSIEEIKTALERFRNMPEQRLTPCIIKSIITGELWLTSAEAWSIAKKRFDDSKSVILTTEIAQAAELAMPLYLDNQRVAAKEAFIKAYDRLLLEAVSKGNKAKWFLMQADSRPNLAAENKTAIKEALYNGYITQHRALQLAESFGIDVQVTLQPLIEAMPSNETRKRLIALKNKLRGDNG